ncbi:unnamed protein product [Linum trigynum]|uniref:Uncharacterized protein n=1 Tax=Linum trigynum TaxID=586398 RepID=A0AAV2FY43_9ROSI
MGLKTSKGAAGGMEGKKREAGKKNMEGKGKAAVASSSSRNSKGVVGEIHSGEGAQGSGEGKKAAGSARRIRDENMMGRNKGLAGKDVHKLGESQGTRKQAGMQATKLARPRTDK